MKTVLKKISVPQLILEFISVVFAVLLALGLNAYKQSQDLKNDAEKLKQSILNECQKNLVKIDSVLLKNKDYADFLDSLVRLDPTEVNGFYFAYDYELLTSGAWQIAQNNAAINALDQEFLMGVADIYHAQAFYLDFSKSVFENIGIFLSRKNELEDANLALAMYYNIGVMNNSANGLKSELQKFIDKHQTD